jgi:hypothetical protein
VTPGAQMTPPLCEPVTVTQPMKSGSKHLPPSHPSSV